MNYIIGILPYMLQGSVVTLEIFFITLMLSIPLGLLIAIGNISTFTPLKAVIRLFILIMRGTPLMLQLMFVYFGFPIIFGFLADKLGLPILNDFKLNSFGSSILAFTLNYSAYFAEIFRGGIESIGKGQYEASFALGLTKCRTMISIVIPQAVRNVLPAVSNETITLVKDTALVSFISLEELLRAAKLVVQRDLTVVPFAVAALFYLLATVFLTWLFKKLEAKFAYID